MIRLALAAVVGLAAALPLQARVPVERATVVRTHPHDPTAFTEGLFFRAGRLFESTGLEGHSDIREVSIDDGRVLRRRILPPSIFGEGVVDWKDELVSLTWKDGRGYRWRIGDLKPSGSFRYAGEGWGLTRNGTDLVMSDGTSQIRFLDPVSFSERRRIRVTDDGQPVDMLNELEWVDGEIYANVWHTDQIARIDPRTGHVLGWLDLSSVADQQRQAGPEGVLNGIAWDAAGHRLFVTGKNWTKVYEIRTARRR